LPPVKAMSTALVLQLSLALLQLGLRGLSIAIIAGRPSRSVASLRCSAKILPPASWNCSLIRGGLGSMTADLQADALRLAGHLLCWLL
jgi:hypothetical protein